jgi:hypothetical protein
MQKVLQSDMSQTASPATQHHIPEAAAAPL